MNRPRFQCTPANQVYIPVVTAVVIFCIFFYILGELRTVTVIWAFVVLVVGWLYKTWNLCTLTLNDESIDVAYYSPLRKSMTVEDHKIIGYRELKLAKISKRLGGVIEVMESNPILIFADQITKFEELNELLMLKYHQDKNFVEQGAASDAIPSVSRKP